VSVSQARGEGEEPNGVRPAIDRAGESGGLALSAFALVPRADVCFPCIHRWQFRNHTLVRHLLESRTGESASLSKTLIADRHLPNRWSTARP